MKIENFNKWGDTSFRVKNQINAYTIVFNFINEKFEKAMERGMNYLDLNQLNQEFITFCDEENIYKYKKNNVVKNRFGFVLKLFKEFGIFTADNSRLTIKDKTKYNSFLEDIQNKGVEYWFFNNFCEFIEFRKFVDFVLNTNEKILTTEVILTILVFDNKEDNFNVIYNKICNNKMNFFMEIAQKYFDLNFDGDNYVDLVIKSYKKMKNKKQKREILSYILDKKKDNLEIPLEIIDLITSVGWNEFKFIYKKIKFNSYEKRINNKNGEQDYKQTIKKFLENSTIDNICLEILSAKNFILLNKDYKDINWRWLNDLGFIESNHINKEVVTYIKENNKYTDIKIINELFPFTEDKVNEILINIQNNDFSFKRGNDKLSDVPNSTLAEYFVNLKYSYIRNISPSDFPKKSRTILAAGTLYPRIHAPGKGPDMFEFIEETKTLVTIETTIHRTEGTIGNNEVFPIIDHVSPHLIKYMKKEDINSTQKTVIFLITNLNDKKSFDNIKKKIDHNSNLIKNCKSKVTSFLEIVENKNIFINEIIN